MIVTTMRPQDRARWAELWGAYLAFYETTRSPEQYEFTWARLHDGRLHGLVARDGDRLVGLAHYLFHEHVWEMRPACYLSDLFVDPEARGSGAGRALIAAVADAARAAGSTRYYWTTAHDNVVARGLYNQLARHRFVRYDFPL